MKTSDLDYKYPEYLVAQEPQRPSRVLWVDEASGEKKEITKKFLLEQIPKGDFLFINNTKVLKRRVFAGKQSDIEILFLSPSKDFSQERPFLYWEVLFPSRSYSIGKCIELPLGLKMYLERKGRPQVVRLSEPLTEDYFSQVGEFALPPYIQKARGLRHTKEADEKWYQASWAKESGSFAAPTASLHFDQDDIAFLKAKGVYVHELTLHVGLGTFLPVTVENLSDHHMHEEFVELPFESLKALENIKKLRQERKATAAFAQALPLNKTEISSDSYGGRVWALGSTVTRALESWSLGLLKPNSEGGVQGFTQLLIQEGYTFQMVDRMITNFHQPRSSLLALVAAFAGLEKVKEAYQMAIENKFRLFSYGDLSVWLKKNDEQKVQ